MNSIIAINDIYLIIKFVNLIMNKLMIAINIKKYLGYIMYFLHKRIKLLNNKYLEESNYRCLECESEYVDEIQYGKCQEGYEKALLMMMKEILI